jgi:L(+)-tartrate dehydratase beta subunit
MASDELKLRFPIDDLDALRELRAGQKLRLDGTVIGIRDATQIAMFDRGERPKMDLRGSVLIHTAPNVRKLGPGKYEKVCIGTTTSARMNRFTRGLMEQYGVRWSWCRCRPSRTCRGRACARWARCG